MTEKVGKIEVVIKGGQPWGFQLQANSQNRSTLTITEISSGGKADLQGKLKVGDNVIKINGIQCLSLEDALQLIDSAFRTLTVLVWRPSQCSDADKTLELGFKKFEVSSFAMECYPTSFPIYENLQDISHGIVQNCIETVSSQTNTIRSKDNVLTSLPNTINKTTKDVRNLKNTSEYLSQQLISSDVFSKADFDAKCEKESYCSDAKWKCFSISKEIHHDLSPLSSQHLSANIKGNFHNSYKENYVPTVDLKEKDYMSQRVLKKHVLESPLESNFDNRVVSDETQGCKYPNCQNQYRACKVHSPPERDIVNSVCSSYKCTVRNQLASQYYLSHSPFISNQIKYENVELFNNTRENMNIKNIKTFSCMNEQSVSKIPLSSSHSEMEHEKNIFSSNPDYANCLNSYNLEDINLTDKNFSRIINYENIPSKDIHSLSTTNSIQDVHQDETLRQPNFTSSDSHVKELINNAFFMFCNESSMNSAVLTNTDDENLDEELIEIENKYENSLNLSDCPTPPLPSPPPDSETEILESSEPLPPPPSFSSEVNIQQKIQDDKKIVQTVYANLEMLKIQCSVVSSATQTTLHLNKKSTINKFSDLNLEMPIQKLTQETKDPLQQLHIESSRETQSLQTQFQNYASLMKTVQNQEKKLFKNTLSLPMTSAYFTTSVPKAKLLTQFTSKFEHKNMTFVKELSNEKEELSESIAKKLRILKQEKAAIQEELKQNEELGNNLATKLENLAKKSETQKFKLHVEELEKITNLLLSLSGRLARTQNALLILPDESSEEKELLEVKYYKLTQQYDEAVHLQRNIEKRNNQVSLFLYKYLTEDELVDYDHFIHMKVKLLVDYKDLLEKIKLGEEQLYALKSSFNTNDDNEIKADVCNNIYVF